MGLYISEDMLNLIMAINALEMNGHAPHTVEVLKQIYEEMYGSVLENKRR